MRHVTSVYASVYHLRHACMLVALVHIHLLRDGATGSRRGVDLEVISRHAPVEVPRNLMVCSITCRGIQLLGRVEARGFPGADGSEIVDRSSPSPSLSPSSLMPPVPATCPLPHACNDCPFSHSHSLSPRATIVHEENTLVGHTSWLTSKRRSSPSPREAPLRALGPVPSRAQPGQYALQCALRWHELCSAPPRTI